MKGSSENSGLNFKNDTSTYIIEYAILGPSGGVTVMPSNVPTKVPPRNDEHVLAYVYTMV